MLIPRSAPSCIFYTLSYALPRSLGEWLVAQAPTKANNAFMPAFDGLDGWIACVSMVDDTPMKNISMILVRCMQR